MTVCDWITNLLRGSSAEKTEPSSFDSHQLPDDLHRVDLLKLSPSTLVMRPYVAIILVLFGQPYC